MVAWLLLAGGMPRAGWAGESVEGAGVSRTTWAGEPVERGAARSPGGEDAAGADSAAAPARPRVLGDGSGVPKGPSPRTAALSSLVLPGAGQAANRAWLKSAAFLGAYGGFLGWAAALNQDKQDAEGKLHAAASDSDRLAWAAEVDRLDDARNAKYWLMGLTALLSMADAYVDAHLRGFDRRMDAEVGWAPGEEGPEATARLTVRWDVGPGAAAIEDR